jgi:hypothetical protein
MKFPEITTLRTIEKRYRGRMEERGLSLMRGLLRMEPNQRLTAVQALRHKYFDPVREEEVVRRLEVVGDRGRLGQQEKRVISASLGKAGEQTAARKQYANPYNPQPYVEKH